MSAPIARRLLKLSNFCASTHNIANKCIQTRCLSFSSSIFIRDIDIDCDKINLSNKTSLFQRSGRLFSQKQEQNEYDLESLQTHNRQDSQTQSQPQSQSRRQGVVDLWNRKKQYGFIVDSETGERHFVHRVNLNCGENINNQMLYISQKVEFDLGVDNNNNNNKTQAINVTGPNGEILTGILSSETFEILGKRRKGITVSFSRDKGHGFVVDSETNESFFVHYNHLICNSYEKQRCLWPQQQVEFETQPADDGRIEAVRVTGPDGIPLTRPRSSSSLRDNARVNVSDLVD